MLAWRHQRLLANNLQPRGPSDPFRIFSQFDNFIDIMSWDCERELGFLVFAQRYFSVHMPSNSKGAWQEPAARHALQRYWY
jgi:hypothetical protein